MGELEGWGEEGEAEWGVGDGGVVKRNHVRRVEMGRIEGVRRIKWRLGGVPGQINTINFFWHDYMQ